MIPASSVPEAVDLVAPSGSPVIPDAVKPVVEGLHSARLDPYLREAKGNYRDALRLYRWHCDLTAALHTVLGLTEVFVRNAMDAQLEAWNRSTKSTGSGSWLIDQPGAPLASLTAGKRAQATTNATKAAQARPQGHRRYAGASTAGVVLTHDDVLTQLTLGVWKDLLPIPPSAAAPNMDTIQNNRKKILWTEALREAFPHAPDSNGAATYHQVLRVHALRNRVAHLECLLDDDVADILKKSLYPLLRSIDPRLEQWVTGVSQVPAVLKGRPKHS